LSWTDKAHKKAEIDKQVQKVIRDPRFKQIINRERDIAYNQALDSFLLISVDYLFRTFRCKKKGILNFVDFFCQQLDYAQQDVEYFKLLNEELEHDTGVNVLGERAEKRSGDKV